MDNLEADKMHIPQSRSTCVRFTRDEYVQLLRDQLTTGKSIPWLLKTAYFTQGLAPPTLDNDTRKAVLRELAYIGNNLNQLTRHVNSGLISDVKGEVAELLGLFQTLKSFLRLDYGHR